MLNTAAPRRFLSRGRALLRPCWHGIAVSFRLRRAEDLA